MLLEIRMIIHIFIVFCSILLSINSIAYSDSEYYDYLNRTDPATRQIFEFKRDHPKPIGILTTGSGKIVEVRETVALNTDPFANLYHVDIITHHIAEKVPERLVHAKGTAAFGYFEVTHDISKYTKADVFNGIGKKTPLVARFSSSLQSLGGNDASRELKGIAFKFYTKEGNLDLLCINYPAYFYRDPNEFPNFVHAFQRNSKTNLQDPTAILDFITKRPDTTHAVLWFLSDHGIPNGYRKTDAFPIHTYVVNNKKKQRYFVRFNFRTEQGIENLSTEEAARIASMDLDYYNRDLYNAIEEKNYPAWRLEMDIMTYDQIRSVDYDPFDVTRLWKKGTYKTVPVGRLVLDRNPDNFFAVVEQSGFSPGRLVPGIPGPIDLMFKTRVQAYRDTQIYRMGVNHNKILVNRPLYAKNYLKDGRPPVGENIRDQPTYYPNSFSGPVPYVDPSLPNGRFSILQRNSIDLDPASTFYNDYLDCDEKERLANNTALLLRTAPPFIQKRAIRLFTLVDSDLGERVIYYLTQVLRAPPPRPPQVLLASKKLERGLMTKYSPAPTYEECMNIKKYKYYNYKN